MKLESEEQNKNMKNQERIREQRRPRNRVPGGGTAAAILAMGAAGFLAGQPGGASASEKVTFDGQIERLFKAKCVKCHGFLLPQKGLKLSSLKHVLKGGESGAVIVPGDPDNSILYRQFFLPATDPKRMPPAAANNDLNDAEKALIRAWIAGGAK